MNLFSPVQIRDIAFRNRIVVSPMCQYSAVDGLANDWHLVHLGSRAVGGAGAIIAEAAAVLPEGRISPDDLGLWSDDHIEPLARVFGFQKQHGAVAGIQLAHAGRKAGTYAPWKGRGYVPVEEGGWRPIFSSSASPFAEGDPVPEALDEGGIQRVVTAFADAARRAMEAGADFVEIHAAHGYLLHQFLSPLCNERDDAYGGSFDNRTRLVREVVEAVRAVWPERLPLWLRISATDWVEGGWIPNDSVALAAQVKALGVDVVDCSSGGAVPYAKIPVAPGYQVPFAARVRREAGVMSAAVGLITEPKQADRIFRDADADFVLLAREFLRDPYWPLRAAVALGEKPAVPAQYGRAFG